MNEIPANPDSSSLEQILATRRALLAKAQSLLDNLDEDDREGMEEAKIILSRLQHLRHGAINRWIVEILDASATDGEQREKNR